MIRTCGDGEGVSCTESCVRRWFSQILLEPEGVAFSEKLCKGHEVEAVNTVITVKDQAVGPAST